MFKKNQSIIYVNFAPYENAGRILDFLNEQFSLVILFSFDFHKLNNKSQSNKITIFKNGEETKSFLLFKLPTPEILLFITLPFIALVIFLNILWYSFKFRREYGKFNYYLTVNAFTAWIGNLLRNFKLVKKTIFWVWIIILRGLRIGGFASPDGHIGVSTNGARTLPIKLYF